MFLENLLFNGNNDLSNKMLHITYANGAYEKLMKEKPNITAEECAIKINKSLRTTKELIKTLKSKNLIIRVGAKKNGFWEVK